MILGFAHPAIVVDDLERARSFYEKMFGFRVLAEEGWADNPAADRATGIAGGKCRGYMLAGHNCFLELFEFQAPAQHGARPAQIEPHELGIRHLAFFVDDVEQETTRFIELGGNYHGRPQNGAVYLRDPFGNIIELCEFPNDNENLLNLPGVNRLAGEQPSTDNKTK